MAPQLALAQDTNERRELPRELAERAAAQYNRGAALQAAGSLTIPADEEVEGDVAVLDGPLSIAGRVRGSVLVINGDLLFERGARVDGDVLVVGGVVDGERGASVGGTVTRNPIPLRYRLDDGLLVAQLDRARHRGHPARRLRRNSHRA